MNIKASFSKKILQFKFDAGTSRGVMKTRPVWYIQLYSSKHKEYSGIGEAAPLEGLSVETSSLMDEKLNEVCQLIDKGVIQEILDICKIDTIESYPSIKFALEMAFLDLNNNYIKVIFNNNFSRGIKGIPINGLVWMGTEEFMLKQISEKINEGYNCIKLKIGALNFEVELRILNYIRSQFTKDEISIRLDANGAFNTDEALIKLEKLAEYQIHSIEQPLKQGQVKAMRQLCASSPIPIALDEELIQVQTIEDKINLIEYIQPQFIILKPTLLGGFANCEEWVKIGEERSIGWWATSALESNIGLNAISQWMANFDVDIPQGLGTGQLFHNNIESPLTIQQGYLYYDIDKSWGTI